MPRFVQTRRLDDDDQGRVAVCRTLSRLSTDRDGPAMWCDGGDACCGVAIVWTAGHLVTSVQSVGSDPSSTYLTHLGLSRLSVSLRDRFCTCRLVDAHVQWVRCRTDVCVERVSLVNDTCILRTDYVVESSLLCSFPPFVFSLFDSCSFLSSYRCPLTNPVCRKKILAARGKCISESTLAANNIFWTANTCLFPKKVRRVSEAKRRRKQKPNKEHRIEKRRIPGKEAERMSRKAENGHTKSIVSLPKDQPILETEA